MRQIILALVLAVVMLPGCNRGDARRGGDSARGSMGAGDTGTGADESAQQPPPQQQQQQQPHEGGQQPAQNPGGGQ